MDPSKTVTSPDDSLRSTFRFQFRKTQLCKFHAAKRCRNGGDCVFAHSADSLEQAPDLTKTSLCNRWMQGVCQLPSNKCQFAHGKVELRRTSAFVKAAADSPSADNNQRVRLKDARFHSEFSAANIVAPIKPEPTQVARTVRELAKEFRQHSGDGDSESGTSTRSGSTQGDAAVTPPWSIFDMSPSFVPVTDPFALDASCYDPRFLQHGVESCFVSYTDPFTVDASCYDPRFLEHGVESTFVSYTDPFAVDASCYDPHFLEHDVESDVSAWLSVPCDSIASLPLVPQREDASEPALVYAALDFYEDVADAYGPDAYNPVFLVCDESDRVGMSTCPAF